MKDMDYAQHKEPYRKLSSYDPHVTNTGNSSNPYPTGNYHAPGTPMFHESDLKECQPELYKRIEELEKKGKEETYTFTLFDVLLVCFLLYKLIEWIVSEWAW